MGCKTEVITGPAHAPALCLFQCSPEHQATGPSTITHWPAQPCLTLWPFPTHSALLCYIPLWLLPSICEAFLGSRKFTRRPRCSSSKPIQAVGKVLSECCLLLPSVWLFCVPYTRKPISLPPVRFPRHEYGRAVISFLGIFHPGIKPHALSHGGESLSLESQQGTDCKFISVSPAEAYDLPEGQSHSSSSGNNAGCSRSLSWFLSQHAPALFPFMTVARSLSFVFRLICYSTLGVQSRSTTLPC